MWRFSPELEMLRETVRKIAVEVIAPRAAEIDMSEEFPWDVKELLQKQGILSIPFPEYLGGCEQHHTAVCLAVEEIARACASSSLILQVQSLGATPILLAGTEAQQKEPLLPATGLTGLSVSRPGVLVTAFGQNPDGPGTLLRLWEQAGVSGVCDVTLPEGTAATAIQPVDLRGRVMGKAVVVKDPIFSLSLGAYAPASFLLQPGSTRATSQ